MSTRPECQKRPADTIGAAVKVMRIVTVCVSITCSAAPCAHAQAYLAFGAGNDSCASWLQTSTSDRLGQEYIAGLWTGLNAVNRNNNRFVGSSTDSMGRIGEVKKICVASPSTSLIEAVFQAYLAVKDREAKNPN